MGKNVTPNDRKTVFWDTLQKRCQVGHVISGFWLIHSGSDQSAFNQAFGANRLSWGFLHERRMVPPNPSAGHYN
jgi:hypothetical protein